MWEKIPVPSYKAEPLSLLSGEARPHSDAKDQFFCLLRNRRYQRTNFLGLPERALDTFRS